MNYLHHPNLLVQFWAAINTEFDKVLDRFVRSNGWLFQDLGMASKKANIGAIYRCVCTVINSNQGREERLDHFLRVNFVILDAAKTQWLAPWRNYVIDPSKGVMPPFLKRQVGGFFLLYMLYTNQPLPNRFHKKQRILMDARDILAMHSFNATMQRLPKTDDQFKELGRQLVVLFNSLVMSDAFEFSAVNDTYATPCHSIRQLLASKQCTFTKIVYTLKDRRDQLYYITHHENVKVFKALFALGRFLPQTTNKERERKSKKKGNPETTSFPPSDKTWSVAEILALENENDIGKIAHSVTCILKSLDFGPILSRKRLTGIADNLLDKEINTCAKVYKAHMKELDLNKAKARKFRMTHESREDKLWPLLQKYYSGENDWVDDVILKESRTSTDQDIFTSNNAYSNDGEKAVINNMTNYANKEDEWLTEDESDIEEFINTPSPKKHKDNSSERKSLSPQKRSLRFLSMPTIL